VYTRPDSASNRMHWCDRCNVPLIGRTCGRCGSNGFEIELTPPGEVRLALEGAKKRLRFLFLRQFGVQQLLPDIFILNKSSGEDRTDEVIIDGYRVALLTYDLEKRDYWLTLRIDGARMLARMDPKKVIKLKKAEGHMKGKYLPPDAIESFDPGIKAGDEVIIQMGKFVGCGSAKVDASSLRSSDKGVKVRDFVQAGLMAHARKAWVKDLVKANVPHLNAKKAKAELELKEAMKSFPLPLSVSFSGGKDSLVVMDIVSSVTKDFATIFIDTGLEHPVTRRYVNEMAEKNGLRLLIAEASDAFDDNFASFGPPAKDFRWCCKVCKLAPLTRLIEEKFPKGTLTIEGNRRLESFSRAHTELVHENPFVPGQVIVNPIRDWSALDVWLYIIWRQLDYNPLYDEDIERVGCWMCPSSLASEAVEISRINPELSRAWDAKLQQWAEENSLPKEFVKHGFWRWKQLPPKMQALAQRLGIEAKVKRADTLGIKVLKGVSPCAAGGYSVEAVLQMPESRGLKRASELLKTVGDVDLVEDFGVVMVRSGKASAKVFAGGQIAAVAESPAEASAFFDKVARATLRANLCARCGICVRTCQTDAIVLKDEIFVDETKCNACGKCAESCVVAHYFDKLAGDVMQGAGQKKKKRKSGPSPL